MKTIVMSLRRKMTVDEAFEDWKEQWIDPDDIEDLPAWEIFYAGWCFGSS
jgi:hypothetical protein